MRLAKQHRCWHRPIAGQVRIICELFAASTAATVSTTLTKLRKARTLPAAGHPSISELLMALNHSRISLSSMASPPSQRIFRPYDFLQGFPLAAVRSFVDDAVAVLTRPAPPPAVLREEVVDGTFAVLNRR